MKPILHVEMTGTLGDKPWPAEPVQAQCGVGNRGCTITLKEALITPDGVQDLVLNFRLTGAILAEEWVNWAHRNGMDPNTPDLEAIWRRTVPNPEPREMEA